MINNHGSASLSNTGKPSSTGLKGVIAGDIAIARVEAKDSILTYRGYSVFELVEHSDFEETIYLLLNGDLPTAEELGSFRRELYALRQIPSKLKIMLESIDKDTPSIDVMRLIVTVMGMLEKENNDFSNQKRCAMRLLVMTGPALLYWYHFANSGLRVSELTGENDSIAENFMKMLTMKKSIDPQLVKFLNVVMVGCAECGLSPPSIYASRITASTKSDYHSAICTYIGTWKGLLHGGASSAVFDYLIKIKSIAEADKFLDEKLKKKRVIKVLAISSSKKAVHGIGYSRLGPKSWQIHHMET